MTRMTSLHSFRRCSVHRLQNVRYPEISLRLNRYECTNRSIYRLNSHSEDKEPIWGEDLSEESTASSLSWLEQQGNIIEEAAEVEAEEEQLAASVGIHVRGDTVFRDEVLRNEKDDSRIHFHRMLHACAERGDFTQAESVIRQMNESNQLPGPKAYHAVVFSYVKGGYARGALNAIRTEVGKGIRPLPQTYASIVVGFLREGDIETAVAVYASNKRAGVPYEGSWRALCSALFSAGDYERATQILNQGEKEGLKPDVRMYQAMIQAMCRKGDLEESIQRLRELSALGQYPDKQILSAVTTAHALAGKMKEAEGLLTSLIKAPGTPSAMAIGSINAVLQMYLRAKLGKEELAERISMLRQLMIKGGMTLDRKGYSLLLEASVHLEDPKVGWLAFQSLQTQPRGSMQYLKDSVIADFLFELSMFGEPSKIDTILASMTTERRDLSNEMMIADDTDRTFITRWLDTIDTADANPANVIAIDGINLDSSSLCAINDNGEALAPTKMSVRELRAELAARQYPLRGNKKELVKQLQKARSEADIENSGYSATRTSKAKKVDVIIAEESWSVGNLEAQNLYEDEREVLPEEEDDETNTDENEFEEGAMKRRTEEEEEEDDDDFDYEDRVFSVMRARGKRLDFHENANFNHDDPGVHEAILLLRRVLSLGAQPTAGDVAYLISKFTSESGHLAKELKEILDENAIVLQDDLAHQFNHLVNKE